MSHFTREWNAPEGVLPQSSFVRNQYIEHPSVSVRSLEEVRLFRESNAITISAGAPNPILSFEESGFPQRILDSLSLAAFSKPTAIQSQAWPVALSGKDMIGIAHTGSGKTLAFLLPAITHIKAQSSISSSLPTVLVLSPTRELAIQTYQECNRFGQPCNVTSVCVYGGAPKSEQLRNLQRGCNILIATPGRLIDFMQDTISLRQVSFLVLDEADRMLDMGFEPQIRRIIPQISQDRQTLMWSATWPKEIQNLANEFLKHPVHVQVGSLQVSANANIKQIIQVVEDYKKFGALKDVLAGIRDSKIVVFVETKAKCKELMTSLRDLKLSTVSMHGDKSQRERDAALLEFRNSKNKILVATDVAARGLDVKDVQYVINYDFPAQLEDYIHRIGRTARAGARGTAISFFSYKNSKMANDLIQVLKDASQEVPDELCDLMRSWINNKQHRSRSPRRENRSRNSDFRYREPGDRFNNSGRTQRNDSYSSHRNENSRSNEWQERNTGHRSNGSYGRNEGFKNTDSWSWRN